MAVLKLNLITITGSVDKLDAAFDICAHTNNFSFENAFDIIPRAHRSNRQPEQNPYTSLLSQLDNLASSIGVSYDAKKDKSFKLGCRVKNQTSCEIAKIEETILKISNEYKQLKDTKESLENQIYEFEPILEQLKYLSGTDINLDTLAKFKFFVIHFGKMPKLNYENLKMYENELDNMFFIPSLINDNEVFGMYLTPSSEAPHVNALLNALHFERIKLSDKIHGTPLEASAQVSEQLKLLNDELSDVNKKLSRFKDEYEKEILECADSVIRLNAVAELKKMVYRHAGVFYITGWVPANECTKLIAKLKKIESVNCTVEAAPVDSEAVQPPTILTNNPIFRPFEMFVKMYGLPSYNEMDPTPLVAITYILFFGLMFGDIGQGIVLILAGWLIWKLKGLNLGRIISLVGFSSTGFGFFYGSIFGREDIIHGYHVMNNIGTVLIASVAIGGFMVLFAMGMNIVNGLKQKNLKKSVFSPNGIVGFALYAVALLLVVDMLGFIKTGIPSVVLFIVLAICALLLFFAELIATKYIKNGGTLHTVHHEKKSALDYGLENFFELFEIILSYLTNTISYIRIGAFALNHVGMMTVVFLLAQTAGGSDNMLVIILGNAFVIGFEGLIVGIQCLRLEFYEIFGRFYEGRGNEHLSNIQTSIGKQIKIS